MIGALALLAAFGSVADAERAFAGQAASGGQWAAFRANAATDAILYAPGRTPASQLLARAAEPSPDKKLAWRPARTLTSCDGTLAYSTGPWTRPDGGRGSFGTIWRADAGGWRWIYDGGHDGGALPDTAGPVREDQAACPGPLGSIGVLQDDASTIAVPVANLVAGASPDLIRAADGIMPLSIRLGAAEAAGSSADRTLQWRINPIAGAKPGAHLLRLWAWDGRRYRLAVFDVTGTGT